MNYEDINKVIKFEYEEYKELKLNNHFYLIDHRIEQALQNQNEMIDMLARETIKMIKNPLYAAFINYKFQIQKRGLNNATEEENEFLRKIDFYDSIENIGPLLAQYDELIEIDKVLNQDIKEVLEFEKRFFEKYDVSEVESNFEFKKYSQRLDSLIMEKENLNINLETTKDDLILLLESDNFNKYSKEQEYLRKLKDKVYKKINEGVVL